MLRAWGVAVVLALSISACGRDIGEPVFPDEAAPDFTVRADGDVAIVAFATTGVPNRPVVALLQENDDTDWITVHQLVAGSGVLDPDSSEVPDGDLTGDGPDEYPLPGLKEDTSYRICIRFTDGLVGCSRPFTDDSVPVD